MLCSMLLFSPNFAVKSIIFPNFGQGPFPKIAGKSLVSINVLCSQCYIIKRPHKKDPPDTTDNDNERLLEKLKEFNQKSFL